MAGYSDTPLAKKLGLRSGQRLAFVNPPDHLGALLGPLPESTHEVEALGEFDLAVIFTFSQDDLRSRFAPMVSRLAPRGILWVAWPKRASKYPTDLTEDVVRAVGLESQLVDVKVCAIDDFWSGLKFVRRVGSRSP
jgi:hypothetical protein